MYARPVGPCFLIKPLRTSSPARVLILDDHKFLRDGMRLMIGGDPDLVVCAEASDETEWGLDIDS
jgi:hypothetical protein